MYLLSLYIINRSSGYLLKSKYPLYFKIYFLMKPGKQILLRASLNPQLLQFENSI